MSSWVEEIGTTKLTDEQAEASAKVLLIMAQSAGESQEKLIAMSIDSIDIAVHNLTMFKEALDKVK